MDEFKYSDHLQHSSFALYSDYRGYSRSPAGTRKVWTRSTSILIEYRNNPKVFHTTVGGLMLPNVMFIYAWRKCTLLKLAAAVMHAVWNYCCIDHTALNRIFTEEPSIICELSRRNIGYIYDKKK